MTIALRSLSSLDPADVQQRQAQVIARVQEDTESLDLRRGVFSDLLVYYHAVLESQLGKNLADYLSGRSLLAIENDPTLADPELVDDVLSNYRLLRKDGARAAGQVAIVVDQDLSITIGPGAVFEANGKQFATPQVFSAKVEAGQVVSSGDRLITRLNDGNFVFTIDVVAAAEGTDYAVKKDTLVVPVVLPANYVTSYAVADFTGGVNIETNSELLLRLQQGMACQSLSNRVTMSSLLRSVEQFSRILRTSIIGLGDPEMLRSRHWIFPVSGTGHVDWYLRSVAEVVAVSLTKDAVLIEKTSDGFGIWQFSLGRDEVPGFYEVVNVRLNDAEAQVGGFAVTADIRGLDLTGGGFVPDVIDTTEGAYTRFQTATIKFKDTATLTTALAVGAVKTYTAEARYLPMIAEVQDYVSSRDIRHFGADCLVRAAVPCFVKISFTINKRGDDPDPDLVAIKEALVGEVNSVGFVGRLSVSQLCDIVHNYLPDEMSLSAFDLFGRIRRPDGTILFLRDAEALVVPVTPELMVSAQTVQFFSAIEDIGITVVSSVPTAM